MQHFIPVFPWDAGAPLDYVAPALEAPPLMEGLMDLAYRGAACFFRKGMAPVGVTRQIMEGWAGAAIDPLALTRRPAWRPGEENGPARPRQPRPGPVKCRHHEHRTGNRKSH